MKMADVYAVVRDSVAGSYPSRFLADVFEKKAVAVASLKDVARKFVRNERRWAASGVWIEIEVDKGSAIISRYREGGDDVSEETVRLSIEKVAVPKGRVSFVEGRAMVKDWGEALTKDLRFRDWDAKKWVEAFISVDCGERMYVLEDLLANCDWWKFIGKTENDFDMPKFASACPWYMEHPECAQIHLEPRDWSLVLLKHPEFANKCDVWEDFDGTAWKELIMRHPEFADRCDWAKLEGEDWAYLLRERPELASHCQWEKLEGRNWGDLLKDRPEFADKCNWNSLRGQDWCELLVARPEFEKHLVVERLRDGTAGVCGLLCNFLEKFPRYIPHCDLTELGDSWARFLSLYPQYADQCDFARFRAENWGLLLPLQAGFVDRVDWAIDWHRQHSGESVLVDLFEKVPVVRERCDWKALRGDTLVDVLVQYPDVADKCNWGSLSKADWLTLLLKAPQFGARCRCWAGFSATQIAELLSAHRELVAYAGLEAFTCVKLVDMLIVAPGLSDLVDWAKVDNDVDQIRVCVACPQFQSKNLEIERWRGVKGLVWKSASGPVVVVPVRGRMKDHPEYPCEDRIRVDRYHAGCYGVQHNSHYDNEHMCFDDARQVVDEVLRRHRGYQAIAINGVYVGGKEHEGAQNFATVLRQWLEGNESEIKLLYLEDAWAYGELA